MFRRRRYQPPVPPSQRIVIVRIPGMENLVSAISDLTAAVNQLVTVEQEVVAVLTTTTPTGTVLTADDQAALDTAVTTVQSVAATLAAALPATPPAPAEPPAQPESAPEATPADGGAPTA